MKKYYFIALCYIEKLPKVFSDKLVWIPSCHSVSYTSGARVDGGEWGMMLDLVEYPKTGTYLIYDALSNEDLTYLALLGIRTREIPISIISTPRHGICFICFQ